MKLTRYSKGFSLVEMLIYIAIVVSLLVIISQIIIPIVRASEKATKARHMVTSAESVDRIIREIRNATTTDATSVFNTSPGRLVLSGSNSAGQYQKVDFYLQSGVLKLKVNDVYQGPLTSSTTNISNLVYRKTTSTSTIVRVEMLVGIQDGTTTLSHQFYDSAILNGR